MKRGFLYASFALLSVEAQAASDIRYGEAPQWVQPPPSRTGTPATEGAIDVRFNDTQVRILDSGLASFASYRIKLLQPEALPLGNINLAWDPQTTDVTVNRLIIHRDGQSTNVLKDQTFRIFQREGGLEQAILDGMLTANLQIPGLRVGDEIEFAVTMNTRDLVFANTAFGELALPVELAPGVFRMSLAWPAGKEPRWMASPDLKPKMTNGPLGTFVTLEDPGKLVVPKDAPPRYATGRFIQFTKFQDWADVSRRTVDLYLKASELPKDASLSGRINAIGHANDQLDKATAALALVQQSIRYVYTGMDAGNYVPAAATVTWERRFGDCKGQSALLLGILGRLGITAEPVLVSMAGGDGLDKRLPSPASFNHVVLRTTISGRRYWLDATRTGDSHLLTDDEVPYRWVLPLGAGGQELANVQYMPPRQPREISVFDIDATAGTDQPAKVKLTRVLRGDQALATNVALKSQTGEASRQSLMKAFENGWVTPDNVTWRFRETSGALEMIVTGTAKLDWDSDEDGPNTELPGGGFYPPDKRERPNGQDQAAPYFNTPGQFSCSVTRIRLPKSRKGHWESGANKIDRVLGGVAYYRQVNLKDDTLTLIRSSRTMITELSPAEAERANLLIPKFDNNKVSVFTYKGKNPVSEISDPNMKDFDSVDWSADGSQCLPERER